MTELSENYARGGLAAYDAHLKSLCGANLTEIALRAAGKSRGRLEAAIHECEVRAVPMTCGEGAITGFAGVVAQIAAHMGFAARASKAADVSGVAEAAAGGASVVFMADEDVFLALNIRNGKYAENTDCTARGFVCALELACGGLCGKEVLLLGYGALGRRAARLLADKRAAVTVYDTAAKKAEQAAADGFRAAWADPPPYGDFQYIFDATNTGGALDTGILRPGAIIAAPGIPLSLTPDARRAFSATLIHDILPIGVAVMLADVMDCTHRSQRPEARSQIKPAP